MSTENEGTEVPPAPSAPPAPPVAASDAMSGAPSGSGGAQETRSEQETRTEQAIPPEQTTAQLPPVPAGADPGAGTPTAGSPGAGTPGAGTPAGWSPPPPAVPSYAGGGGGHGWGASYHPPAPAPGPGRSKGGMVAAVLVAALLAGGVGGGVGYWAAERNDTAVDSTTISASDTPADLKRKPGTVAAIAAKALPSVVTIDAKGGAAEGEGGTGTGFVYDKEGHILTNNHVVASAADGGSISATFSDGKKYEAEVIGRAEGYDVAVLKLKNAKGLAPLPLGNSDRVAVGDSSIAIGAPFGLSNTVTTGIVSAKHRPVASSDATGGNSSYMSALQTDASINPGNSGGPLLDARGAVIGINSAIKPAENGGGLGGGQGGSIGLGFAIPINQVKNVAEQLIKTGKAVYPMIGASVSVQEGATDGARIAEDSAAAITKGGPADKAGLKPGDLITRLGDRPIDSGPTLISEIWTHKPGDTVKLTYERGGDERTVDVTLGTKGED